jgi:geranylgeranyl diphosphate synthase type II
MRRTEANTGIPLFLEEVQESCNAHLEVVLPQESEAPSVIHEAMRYSVFAGGKRFRPALVMASGRMFGASEDALLEVACGIELIHTYSLIHDDLPCMDDDDLRRGKPTLHKVFGDGIAVLAGDALFALAFEVIAGSGCTDVLREIARATGTLGMIGGQVADILFEGKDISISDLEYIHSHKTGSLIAACVTSGTCLGNGTPEEIESMRFFGARLGLAFQIVDDILDETGDAETLGKTPGGDRERGKNTYPKVHGLEGSIVEARKLIEAAKNELVLPDRETILLRSLADFVINRVT